MTHTILDDTSRTSAATRSPRSSGWFRRIAVALALTAATVPAALGGTLSPAHTLGSGTRLFSGRSWLAVAVADGSMAPGARLIQWGYTGGAEQLWNVPSTGSTGTVQNVNSRLCVTTDFVANHWLYQDVCDGRRGQDWQPSRYTGAGVDTGYVSFFNPYSGLTWDVQYNSVNWGANIVGWYANGGLNQAFLRA